MSASGPQRTFFAETQMPPADAQQNPFHKSHCPTFFYALSNCYPPCDGEDEESGRDSQPECYCPFGEFCSASREWRAKPLLRPLFLCHYSTATGGRENRIWRS